MFVYIIHKSRDISLRGRSKEDWRVTTFSGVSVKSVHITGHMYTVTSLINRDNKEGGENWFTAVII